MTSLVEQIAGERATADAGALLEYVELLRRERNPQPGDAERLKAVMVSLGLSAEDVRRDASDIAHAQRLEKSVASLPELDRKRIAAAKAMSDHGTETRRIAEQRRLRQAELDSDSSRADLVVRRAEEKKRELVVHKRKSPRLFDTAWTPPAAQAAETQPNRLGVAAVLVEPPMNLVGPGVGGVEGEYGASSTSVPI